VVGEFYGRSCGKNSHKVSVGKPEWKIPLVRPSRGGKVTLELILRVGFKDMD
jgi:hypothetical protein